MGAKQVIGVGILAALFSGAGFFFFGKQGIYYLYREEKGKSEEIRKNERTIDSLQQEISRLTNDTAFIERIAREKLGMARPDEKIYKFIEKRR
jgi:cell division protein FtsL